MGWVWRAATVPAVAVLSPRRGGRSYMDSRDEGFDTPIAKWFECETTILCPLPQTRNSQTDEHGRLGRRYPHRRHLRDWFDAIHRAPPMRVVDEATTPEQPLGVSARNGNGLHLQSSTRQHLGGECASNTAYIQEGRWMHTDPWTPSSEPQHTLSFGV